MRLNEKEVAELKILEKKFWDLADKLDPKRLNKNRIANKLESVARTLKEILFEHDLTTEEAKLLSEVR